MRKFLSILNIISVLGLFIPQFTFAARLWQTGVELQSTTSGVDWDSTLGSPTINTTTKRSGAASLRCNPTAAAWYIRHRYAGTGATTIYARFYIYISTATDGTETIVRLGDSGFATEPDVYLQITTGNILQLRDSAGTQIGSNSSALNTGQWYRVELESPFSPGDTGNTYKARLDGTEFASGTGAGFLGDAVNFLQVGIITASTADIYFDDIAVNDNQGSAQTSYPGAGSIVHMHPTAAGDAAATTGLFSAVDEVTPNDATDYIEQDTIAEVDYNFETSATAGIGASDTITLVQVGTRQHPETAAAAGWRALVMTQTGGTTAYGNAKTHNDTTWKTNGDALPKIYSLTSYVDPQAGGAWTPALLDTMQAGVDVTDATPNMFFSTIWALVEYVPSGATTTPIRLLSSTGVGGNVQV